MPLRCEMGYSFDYFGSKKGRFCTLDVDMLLIG